MADEPDRPDAPADHPNPGDRLAVDQLLASHLPALMVFLRHQTGEALAARETIEDLAQSVCREILQDLPNLRFDSEDKFRSYLFLQAVRKVVDRARFHQMARRDQRREQHLPAETRVEAEYGIYSHLVTGSQVASAKEQMLRVQQCLQNLPDAQREAVLLSRVAGLSYAEIAHQKGVSESTIRSLAARGLARICTGMDCKDG